MRERLLFSKKPRFPLKIIILVLITVIILLVAYQLVSRAKWDGISRFTIVFQSISNSESGENELVIFSIEPRQHRAVYIVVPVELQLNVPYGYKTYLASQVYKLGKLDNMRGGGKLIMKSFESTFGIAFNGYFIALNNFPIKPVNTLEELINLKRTNFSFSGILNYLKPSLDLASNFDTNISLQERFMLWNAIRKIRVDQIKFIDLNETLVLKKTVLPDGVVVKELIPDFLDLIVKDDFYDSIIRADNTAIEVVNATDQEKLASQFSKILEHLGGNVVLKTSATNFEEQACPIYITNKSLSNSALISRLQRDYGCKLVADVIDIDQADVKIVLGKKFIE
ncbi:hypothetical protein A2960_02475 [Candidatus Gottesmanbacteria bacterium RIFCSPLOWO2_01_FULL_39_12b]|uniref:LytR/CpsA/Psr regulator C-terminal domain-containing protein n=1 Tax=Candidatus Gottesmanbacteria bacterium RIFCSPLOWO2_01_FULL_39_12b TaxID=1798388 RepID=A0A1F6AQP4_9BACT|nr:MAG: hypothetical protein A2960_02475 [Candidatus Gottesmanbacteria bacterium RIFCSPLOWO2_01_FULL_39_12b]